MRFLPPVRVPAALLLVVALGALAGCGGGDNKESTETATGRPKETSPSTRTTPPIAPPMGDADLLAGVPVGAAVTNKELAAAEQAWMSLLTAMQPPQPPAEWENKPPTKEAQAKFRLTVGESMAKTAAMAHQFYTRYPSNENAAEAREREHYLLTTAMQLGYTNALTRLDALEADRLKDPALPEDDRLQLRIQQIQRTAFRLGGEDSKVVLTELEKGARAVQKEFPKKPEVAGLFLAVAEAWLERGDVTKARSLATEVSSQTSEEELKSTADALVKKLDRLGKPVNMKFTAIDGRSVDVTAMKGKVVLLDFWATWCAPCMQELPNLKETYQKLHDRGFEIVGISLDHGKEDLKKVVDGQKLSWPQHFDEENENNRFAAEFNISSIPTMWLIDKKGVLRDLHAREDLATKVEKLLAE
jgi:thiol-disulfide isomerase/thioredoxin